MSIHYQHIILYGYEIGYDTFKEIPEGSGSYEHQLIESYGYKKRQEGDVAVVLDGTNGEYCYLGVLQYKSKDSRDGQPIIEPQETTVPDATSMQKLGEIIGKYDIPHRGEPTTHIFTHIS